MDNKKQKEELYKTIWKIANELRGSVDGWDFKQYVLGFLFYRFISENIEKYVNENQMKAGMTNFLYRELSDEEALRGKNQILKEKGLYIPPSELFCNVRKNAKNNENLNVVISNIFSNIELSARGTSSEGNVKGLFDDFTIDDKLGNTVDERNEKLVKMLDAIGDLELGDYQENNIDLFGDAYEFLMTMYASSAGKSGGEFFTPQEVGELLAKIVIGNRKTVNKVYDPACGSGGLLLKFAKILGRENVKEGFFGQEINLATYNLARINMFLHNINYNNFSIVRGDTLIHPAHSDEAPFDAIISNPPYSIKWAGKEDPLLINDERFSKPGVLAPSSKADLAFTLHILSWLSNDGTAAIVEFPGVLYREGTEQKIRKYLVDNNFVDTVIKLPKDLFFGTSISTCVLVLKKNRKDTNVLFVDASSEFIRNTSKNKLSDENIKNIIKIIKKRKNIEGKSYLATYEEIKENDYNIYVNSFVRKKSKKEKINIENINKQLEEILPEQRKIRKKLEKILKDIDTNNYNKINKLIKEMCPNGVKFKKLKDVTLLQAGDRITTAMMSDNYKYDVIGGGTLPTGKYNKSNRKHCITISRAGSAGFVNWQEDNFWATDVCFTASSNNNYMNIKFIYHYLKNAQDDLQQRIYGGSMPKLEKKYLWNYLIPVPPLKVQNEIVKILDEFSELQISLQQELNSRRNQYKYYRNKLVKFNKL